jgi:hypothetical protein
MRNHFLVLLVCSCLVLTGQAQSGRMPGELIVRLSTEDALATCLAQWPAPARQAAPPVAQRLGLRHPIYLLRFAEADAPSVDLLHWLRQQPGVYSAQWNYRVAFRRSPNDPYFGEQWDMEIIQAREAWEITTGGTTARGDEIVVAIMDSGFEPDHPDIAPNLWHNPAENPADGIDNDGNGYIDDDIGWDYILDTPAVRNGAHGLGSAGIIGARGNNAQGVAGLNWDVRMMHFSFVTISQLIRAYEYVIDQRARYNESRGSEGAFVVATNASFGQGQVFCEEQPVWAGMYDLLGEVGILTAAGADNAAYDVDQLGDMPSTCPTPYLLTVCNTTAFDELSASSAYGATSIDLGAPGSGTFTTRGSGTYAATFGGNSAATPHVTGAIALLYSLPCSDLARQALEQPAETALFVRDMILQGVDTLASLQQRTVTGGRLNVGRSLANARARCDREAGELEATLFPNPAGEEVTLTFVLPDYEPLDLQVFNSLGQLVYQQEITTGRFGDWRETIDISRWPIGIYLVCLRRGKERTVRKLMVYRGS